MLKPMPQLISVAALSALAAQPCAAAEEIRDRGMGQHRSSVFAGATLRLRLGGRQAARPEARLQLTSVHSYEDRGSASPAIHVRPDGFQIGASKSGKPAFYIAGREAKAVGHKLQLSDTGTVLLIAAGLGIAVVAVVALSVDDKDFDFFDEE